MKLIGGQTSYMNDPFDKKEIEKVDNEIIRELQEKIDKITKIVMEDQISFYTRNYVNKERIKNLKKKYELKCHVIDVKNTSDVYETGKYFGMVELCKELLKEEQKMEIEEIEKIK